MAEYKTPGVYIEEISQSTPTAAQVATAIPAFIGYTQKAVKNGANVTKVPVYVNSLLEYKEIFGGDFNPSKISVVIDADKNISKVEFDKQFYTFNNVRMFFSNGGGQCCIISVGNYTEKINKDKISEGIEISKRESIPTMILLPEAVLLPTKEECYALQQEALMLCNRLKDRVAILDIYDGYKPLDDNDDVVTNFRTGIGINGLAFGAAYYPWVQSLFVANFSYKNVKFKDDKGKEVKLTDLITNPHIVQNLETASTDLDTLTAFVQSPLADGQTLNDKFAKVDKKVEGKKGELIYHLDLIKKAALKLLEIRDTKILNPLIKNEIAQKTGKSSIFASIIKSAAAIDLAIAGAVIDAKKDFLDIDLSRVTATAELAELKEEPQLVAAAQPLIKNMVDNLAKFFSSVKKDAIDLEEQFDKSVYENIGIYKAAVNNIYTESAKLPPGGAIAGIFAQVDSNRGVWKAPANVSVSNIVKPWVEIDNDQQENLNVDIIAGKSINAIRTFPGQGALVWGARTLAGNDSEWRYISVRRFFNMAEKTLKLGSSWAVFEPNVEMTWIRIKAMMNNFLTNLWKAGALVGATPAEAFFVNIGLGSTMTPQDILDGKMIIEVGMAVVRPAEFIIIKFSHKQAGGAAEAAPAE